MDGTWALSQRATSFFSDIAGASVPVAWRGNAGKNSRQRFLAARSVLAAQNRHQKALPGYHTAGPETVDCIAEVTRLLLSQKCLIHCCLGNLALGLIRLRCICWLSLHGDLGRSQNHGPFAQGAKTRTYNDNLLTAAAKK